MSALTAVVPQPHTPTEPIPGLVTQGVNLIHGLDGTGRTWLAAHATAAMLTGRPILGATPTGSHKVAWVATGRNGNRELASELHALGVTTAQAANCKTITCKLGDPELDWAAVKAALKRDKTTVLVIESVPRSMPGGAGMSADTLAVLIDRIAELADGGVTVIARTTSNLTGPTAAKTRAMASGHVIGEFADRVILLERDKTGTMIDLRISGGGPTRTVPVTLDGPSLFTVGAGIRPPGPHFPF